MTIRLSSLGLKWMLGAVCLCAVSVAGCGSTANGGGSGGSGGNSGSGGSSGPICTSSPDDLISDFKSDNGVAPVDGRSGGWYTYGDGELFGLLMPAEGGGAAPDFETGNPDCSKEGSLHVSAKGFTTWGAAVGVDIAPKSSNGVKGTYDASKYKGIAFWAKGSHLDSDGKADNTPVKFAMVKFLDPYTDKVNILPMDQQCDYKPGMPDLNCSPYVVKLGYGYSPDDAKDYPRYVDSKIDSTWRRFEILFADAKQDKGNAGRKSPGDKLAVSQLLGLAIQVNVDYASATEKPYPANNFEIWLDDISFVK